MDESTENPARHFDTIVIGAGPAGCEAAVAAAGAGARTLCLAINLDNVGFPPANPIIAEGAGDRRHDLLAELRELGGALPGLLARESVGRELADGTLLADRRNLGLAYKQLVESTPGSFPRQGLATGIERSDDGWLVETRLGERFSTASVVIAAGTFLQGEVDDGGKRVAGGRMGEIPANSLAESLQEIGVRMVRISAVNMPRVSAAALPLADGSFQAGGYRFLPDGGQLSEQYMHGPYLRGARAAQLDAIRDLTGIADAWMTRGAYGVSCLALAGSQVNGNLEAVGHPGLFFAGRSAGSCNYTEAAVTGWVAGTGAAGCATNATAKTLLINKPKYVAMLCDAIAEQDSRPTTIRIEGPGC